jgi:serine/threonine protein kinase
MLSLEGKQLGNYDVIKQIRVGGMGAVYEGRQRTAFGRRVAIKVILNDYASDRDMRRRFAREAHTIARLQHPHILPLIEFGDERGILYLVMPFIEGGTLTSYLRRYLPNLAEVASIYQQLLDAVEFAHDEGLIHRDIKSSNIMLETRRNGPPHVYLGDFGLVRFIRSSDTQQVGKPIPLDQVPGTPHYMAPEQTRGIITPQTDIYALGVILFQLLTGSLPYNDSDDIKVIKMHLHDPIPSPSEYDASIPVELSEVVNAAMAKMPDNRYQNVSELRIAFRAAVNGSKRRKTLSRISTPSDDNANNEHPDTLLVRDDQISLINDVSFSASLPSQRQPNNSKRTLKLLSQPQESTCQHPSKPSKNVHQSKNLVEPGPSRNEPGMAKHAPLDHSIISSIDETDQQHLILSAIQENTPPLSRHKQRQQSNIPPSRRLLFGIGIGLVVVLLSFVLLQVNPLSGFSASKTLNDQAIVTISRSSVNIKDDFLLTASTQYTAPDSTKYIIPASLLQSNATNDNTASTTGNTTIGGSVAHGQLFVTNNSLQNYTIQSGQIFRTKDGTEIRADETATIPHSFIGQQSSKYISASAVKPGTKGNIPAHAVNISLAHNVFIQNLASFAGGTDAYAARTVTQSDIDLLTTSLTDKLKTQIAKQLKSQLSTDQRQIGDPKYTVSSQSNAQPGTVADHVRVTVTVRASQLVYKPSDIQLIGKTLLVQVVRNHNSQYQQKGNLEVSNPKVTQNDTTTAIMNVTIGGSWFYQFNTQQIQQWKDTIKGMTLDQAKTYLLRQSSHIQTVNINLPGEDTKLPITTDRIQITIT